MVKFDGTSFGSVTVDGKLYRHDIYVYPNGKIALREGSHTVVGDEIRRILKSNPEVIVIGTGQAGCVTVLEEAARVAKSVGISIVREETHIAIGKFNELVEKGKRVAAIIHVTC